MSDNVIELTEENFETKTSKGKWAVDFWAEWCAPCKIMSPEFDAAAKELKGKVHFAKVDIEANYGLADKFQVMSIPSMILFNDGEVSYVNVGALKKGQIISAIDSNL